MPFLKGGPVWTPIDSFVEGWLQLQRQHQELVRDGDFRGAKTTAQHMADMAKSLGSSVFATAASRTQTAQGGGSYFAFSQALTAVSTGSGGASSVSISPQATAKAAYPSTTATATVTVEVNNKSGKVELQQVQIDDHFFDRENNTFESPSLWMNPGTVAALQQHVGDRMPRLLAANGIPEAPAKISFSNYDNSIQIPNDYPYADKLRAALDNDFSMSHELQETSALSGQLAYYSQFDPLTKAWAGATSDAQMDAITTRFGHLYTNAAPGASIDFLFGSNGSMAVTANGKPFDQYVRDTQQAKT